MSALRATVDTHVRIRASAVSSRALVETVSELAFENPDRDKARREHMWGWEKIPKTIDLWAIEDDDLVVPRGFARKLPVHVGDLSWDDRRTFVPIDTSGWPVVQPKGPHQQRAFDVIETAEQGVLQMPPGSGKTVAVLEGIRRARQRAIVIVDKTNIARQWQDRCKTFLGFTPGMLGDGVWDDSGPIVIAMQQSLWARREALPGSFWDGFGFVCLDECHHAAAGTYYDILQRFPAAWRIGVSATPYKSKGLEPFIDAVLGETILRAPGDDVLVPEVRVTPTQFSYRFWPTHKVRKDGTCGFRYCTRGGKVHKNNYSDMMNALVNSVHRNSVIASNVLQDVREGRSVLVVSKRLAQLDAIARWVAVHRTASDVWQLTGRQDTDERMKVAERAKTGSVAIFSTIADEALDIPMLSSVHLAWPTRNTDAVKQQVGRIMRRCEGKPGPLIHDYIDAIPILKSQHFDRMAMYRQEGYTDIKER